MPLRLFLLLVAVLAVAFGGDSPATQSNVSVAPQVEVRTAAGETVRVIVGVDSRFVPEGELAGAAAVGAQRADLQASVNDVMSRAAVAGIVTERAFESIPFFPAWVTRDSLAQLRAMRGVISVEEVQVAERQTYASVPLTNTPASWSAGFNGSGWTVAVLDSGADTTHSMLAGSLLSEACYSSVAQSLCPGGVTETTAAGSGQNCDWFIDGCDHGTHVASIAVGSAGTSFGPGMAPGAWLIPMQVFGRLPSGALTTDTVDWMRGLTRVLTLAGPNNVNRIAAVNMSLGGGQYPSYCDAVSPAAKAAIDNLRSIGIATIVASGNTSFTNAMSFPACISSAISVGNTTKFTPLTINSTSNEASFLSLLAPGTDIDAASSFGLYAVKSGTSMAAPHVAGAWAVLKQAFPSASVSSVLAALRGTGTPVVDTRTGRSYPFINVNAARLALGAGTFNTPGAPTNFTASASGNTVSLSWSAPAAGTGGTPTGYTVIARGSAGGAILQSVPVGNVTSLVTPAPNGVYHVSVLATNANGPGLESPGATLTVPAVAAAPGAPTGLAVNVSGATATFSWQAPAGGGPVSSYVIVAGMTPGFTSPIATLPVGTATSYAVPGVPAGLYYVRVVSQGPGGTSGGSNEVSLSVGGATLPGTPTLNAPSVAGTTVSLSWAAGGGGAATSFVLSASATPTGAVIASVPVTGTSISIPGVPRGTYFVRLTAHNAAGGSAPSNQVTGVVP
jgi:hypothetical protein